MGSHLPGFIAVSVLLSVAPGPDFALVTRNALAHGRRGALLTCAGLAVGVAWWVVATGFGLAVLLRASAQAYTDLRIVGAVYLTYLGVRAILEAGRGALSADARPRPPRRAAVFIRQGALSAGLNPKLGAFFVTFLPQFTDSSQALTPQVLLLGGLFAVIGVSWMAVYGVTVSRLRPLLARRVVRRWLERVSGCVLVGFGVRLAVDRG